MLTTLIQELQEVKWQLGLLVADTTATKQELAGIVGTTLAPCQICRCRSIDQHVEDEFDRGSAFSDEESQRPL